jgi:two-component system, chemotaxis family, chemotaxis protein CheY
MKRVLVIEDDALVREAIRHVLMRAGYGVDLASDGLTGLDLFAASAPDLVITDLFMPGRDGLETIVEMKRLRPQQRIMAISGSLRLEGADFLHMAKELGAVDVLSKPFNAKELIGKVETCLAQ